MAFNITWWWCSSLFGCVFSSHLFLQTKCKTPATSNVYHENFPRYALRLTFNALCINVRCIRLYFLQNNQNKAKSKYENESKGIKYFHKPERIWEENINNQSAVCVLLLRTLCFALCFLVMRILLRDKCMICVYLIGFIVNDRKE